MKRILLLWLALVPPASIAEPINIAALSSRCVPGAPLITLEAIIQAESGGVANAMQIDFPHALARRWKLREGTLRLNRQPATRLEALAWLDYFEERRVAVDIGLMQVSTLEAAKRGIPPETLFDPCTNIRAGWQILQEAYRIEVVRYGPGQLALQHAIYRYNTGNSRSGMDNGYLDRVLAAVHKLQ